MFRRHPPRRRLFVVVVVLVVIVVVLVEVVVFVVGPRRISSSRSRRCIRIPRATGKGSRGGLGSGLRLFAVRRRIGRPEMTAAPRADPELIRRPRHARTRIAHVHLGAAALTPDVRDRFRLMCRDSTTMTRRDSRHRARRRASRSRMGRPKATLPARGRRHVPDAHRPDVSTRRRRRRRRRGRPRGGRHRSTRSARTGLLAAIRREPRLRAGSAVVAARRPARRRSARASSPRS